jgi:hypothetical protein
MFYANKKHLRNNSVKQTNYLIQKETSKMAAISPYESCDLVLRHVRTSCLNFAIQETPYSVYLTIRKSFSQSPRRHATSDNISSLTAPPQPLGPFKYESALETLQEEFKVLKSQKDDLEKVKDDISMKFEEEVILSEHLKSELATKNEKLQFVHAKFEELENKAAKTKDEYKRLGEKHLKTYEEVKSLKLENEELKKENKKTNIGLTTMKKQTKETNYNHEQVIKKLEDSIKELTAFKITKVDEEKALKKKQKKVERKQRSINKLNHKPTPPELEKRESSSDLLDPNQNEFDTCYSNEVFTDVDATVPTNNLYECLANLEAEPQEVIDVDEKVKDHEFKIRNKAKSFIKKKLEAKLDEQEINEDEFKVLEEALADDMEEILLEELEDYKTALEMGMREDRNIDPYGPPEGCSGYYWGGEDSCEMIFYD